MPDLGKHAFVVLGAYVSALAILAGLVLVTWAEARAAKRRLARLEEQMKDKTDG